VLPIPGVRTVVPPQTSDRPAAGGVSKLKAGAGLGSAVSTPIPVNTLSPSKNTSPASPSENTTRSKMNDERRPDGATVLEHALVDPIDVEFEQLWETVSDFDEVDREDILQ
jgi:hypothetical protein